MWITFVLLSSHELRPNTKISRSTIAEVPKGEEEREEEKEGRKKEKKKKKEERKKENKRKKEEKS